MDGAASLRERFGVLIVCRLLDLQVSTYYPFMYGFPCLCFFHG